MSGTPLGPGYTKRDGIIYGPDGKPCRQCNSLKDLMNMGNNSTTNASPFAFSKRPRLDLDTQEKQEQASVSPALATEDGKDENSGSARSVAFDPEGCPPDVEALGRATWTFLHTTAANYPVRPTPVQQNDMSAFLRTFSMFYPCWVCAEDFREWMAKRENQPVLDSGWAGLGQWMCRAHNEVNRKLGKDEFDCKLWRQRWKDGFKDGRCDP
ncbi:putative FAD dependent sulfhydryl oxidase Erv1 [Taphrina deformans PYCC 5710]|uniref:Sulfhydryl oxidase n=1 Tax=Taphrina deformans (strain PYCC 5710 / ATCC 11124 / CBS 356.35 / IMI 108563 / JCM 9778 / NBRC 8474) TaxID=1097556 RepID=R4X8C5_TAPDE|nr:putative FAD dependent sulfhydryl oxidase Erv1 [Taphrina deformans PYCC 5710]|eukprot:CCG81824.1 putative FAD dependent sulfhydryl oxidase Erv1 [Taphrina deformans PYCC 5710]